MEQKTTFFTSLFDFSFSEFITTKIIKILYGLSIVLNGFFALFLIVIGFGRSTVAGILMLLIVAPLVFLLGVIYTRVLLENMIVLFRIGENIQEIAKQGRKEG
jgi:hypothetical protein